MKKKQRLHIPECRGYITADQVVDGVPINPILPLRFDCTSNDFRPLSHQKFWYVPYIVTDTVEERDESYQARTDEYADAARKQWFGAGGWREKWLESWPTGARFDVRCLDGGAWDRLTWLGSFPSLDAAITFASAIRNSYRPAR